jgi:hypothetical protein
MKFKKSFNVSIRLGGAAAQETAAAPASDSAVGFQPAASRYRRHLGRFVLVGIAGFFLSCLSLLVSDKLFPWLAYPGVALVALSLIIFFTLPSLICPACGRSADGFDRYCPCCGAAGLEPKPFLGTRCNACGKAMGRYKYRNYKIRFCTHCGALLDAAGV